MEEVQLAATLWRCVTGSAWVTVTCMSEDSVNACRHVWVLTAAPEKEPILQIIDRERSKRKPLNKEIRRTEGKSAEGF